MKMLMRIIFFLGLSFVLTLMVSAIDGDRKGMAASRMPGMPGMPGFHFDIAFSRTFDVADIDLDSIPEIVILVDDILIVMDNHGTVLFTKEVDGIGGTSSSFGDSREKTLNPQHEGTMPFMKFGMVCLKVADIDIDLIPEIIILDIEKFIVLDNKGEPKSTIPLPDVVVFGNRD